MILKYNRGLKTHARALRQGMTDAKLVVELDGSQHFEQGHAQRDVVRDSYLRGLGLHVLRFDNLQALRELDAVLGEIARVVGERVNSNQNQKPNPPQPPFCKGGSKKTPHFTKGESEKAPSFTKRENEKVPPFEKGGLGGICFSGFPETSEGKK